MLTFFFLVRISSEMEHQESNSSEHNVTDVHLQEPKDGEVETEQPTEQQQSEQDQTQQTDSPSTVPCVQREIVELPDDPNTANDGNSEALFGDFDENEEVRIAGHKAEAVLKTIRCAHHYHPSFK